eukprot:SAG31_NODE_1551_length_7907_cov_29.930072_7_plen_107_part_00
MKHQVLRDVSLCIILGLPLLVSNTTTAMKRPSHMCYELTPISYELTPITGASKRGENIEQIQDIHYTILIGIRCEMAGIIIVIVIVRVAMIAASAFLCNRLDVDIR